MPPTIDHPVRAGLVTPPARVHDVPAVLRYRLDDPFAVRACFPPQFSLGGTEVVWVFARDLLVAGLSAPSGSGDVRIRPSGRGLTVVEFHAPAGTAVVRMETVELRRFLDRSYALVPPGDEHLHLDVEGELAALLREA